MRNYWIVHGSEENWKKAFMSNGIWGLEDTKNDKVYWSAVAPNDVILFYVSGKVKRVVGYGIVRNKFYQDAPLWKDEIEEGRVIWPLRFEFDVEFLLDMDRWQEEGIPVAKGGQFRQPLIIKELEEIKPIILNINPKASQEILREFAEAPQPKDEEIFSPDHEGIKKLLLEIGKLQSYIADIEYRIGTERLDVVWRRIPEAVPSCVFEVQVGGDLYHALGKLKHAHDIWNSRIFLVGSSDILSDYNKLLAGTFHELQNVVRFIETEKIQSLHKSKGNIHHIEKELGLVP